MVRNICISGDGGTSTCNGDSGGPLEYLYEDGKYRQIGITVQYYTVQYYTVQCRQVPPDRHHQLRVRVRLRDRLPSRLHQGRLLPRVDRDSHRHRHRPVIACYYHQFNISVYLNLIMKCSARLQNAHVTHLQQCNEDMLKLLSWHGVDSSVLTKNSYSDGLTISG